MPLAVYSFGMAVFLSGVIFKGRSLAGIPAAAAKAVPMAVRRKLRGNALGFGFCLLYHGAWRNDIICHVFRVPAQPERKTALK